MSDMLGPNAPHPVVHNKKYVIIHDIPVGLNIPIADAVRGFTSYSGMDPVWVPSNAIWIAEAVDWNVNNHLPSAPLPNRWTTDTSSVNESSLKSDVIEKAQQLKADALLNIVEANQMWPSVRDLTTSVGRIAAADSWKIIRKNIKVWSGAYLAWKFGISPILSDIMRVHKHLGVLKRDFKRHVEQQSQRFSKQAEFPVLFGPEEGINYTYFGIEADVTLYHGTCEVAPNIRYVLVVKPKIQYETELFQRLDYAMSRFATSPASLAWELIPFSFIVDWLVDLRGVLRCVDKLLGFSPYNIVSFTRSYSYKLLTNVQHRYKETCYGNVICQNHVGAVRYSHYERTPVSMGGSPPIWRPRFGKNQAGITAALIGQKLNQISRLFAK